MNSPIIEMEAKLILEKATRKAKASKILASGSSRSALMLASSIAVAVASYAMFDFTATWAVKMLICISFVFGIFSQIDTWRLQRRLDAAIELLQQSEEERG